MHSCITPRLLGGFLFPRAVFVLRCCRYQIAVGRYAIDDRFYRRVIACEVFYFKQVKIESLVSAEWVVLGFFDLVTVYLSGRRGDVAFVFVQRVLDTGRRALVLHQAEGVAKKEVDARCDGSNDVASLVAHFVDDAVAFVDDDFPFADLCPAPGEEAFAQVSGFSLSACCRSGRRLFSCGRFSSSPAAAAKGSAAVAGTGCAVVAVADTENGASIPVGSAKGSSAAAVCCAVSSPVAVAGRFSSVAAAYGVNVPPVAVSANGSSAVAGVVVCGVAVSSHGKVWSLKVSGASGTVAGGGDDAGIGAGW